MRRRRTTSCPDCAGGVPAGRWCNRCGALLQPVERPRPVRTPRAGVAVGGLGLVLGLLGAVVVSTSDTGPTAPPLRHPAVVLADAAPAPPAVTPSPRRAPAPMVDVICSDLRPRSVPAELVGSTEPGTLADLSWGPCVVMGPEGVAVP